MTGQALIDAAAAHWLAIALFLVAEVAMALALGFVPIAGRAATAPWTWVYSVLVYAACIPGVLAALLTAYTLLFLRGNLLAVNALVYFAPMVAMAITLGLIRRHVDFDSIPGFDRLWGLIVMLAVTFGIVFVISRLFVGVAFFGSIASLVAISVFVFALLKWGAHTAFRDRGAPKTPPPKFGA